MKGIPTSIWTWPRSGPWFPHFRPFLCCLREPQAAAALAKLGDPTGLNSLGVLGTWDGDPQPPNWAAWRLREAKQVCGGGPAPDDRSVLLPGALKLTHTHTPEMQPPFRASSWVLVEMYWSPG